jgi:hypothetical protein
MSSVVPAAPEPLETVRALVNTLDVEDGVEALATPAELAAWLRHRSLLQDRVANPSQPGRAGRGRKPVSSPTLTPAPRGRQ